MRTRTCRDCLVTKPMTAFSRAPKWRHLSNHDHTCRCCRFDIAAEKDRYRRLIRRTA